MITTSIMITTAPIVIPTISPTLAPKLLLPERGLVLGFCVGVAVVSDSIKTIIITRYIIQNNSIIIYRTIMFV